MPCILGKTPRIYHKPQKENSMQNNTSIKTETRQTDYIIDEKAAWQKLLASTTVSADGRLMTVREYIISVRYPTHVEKPVPVIKTKRRNSSGYAWRNYELTRQELLCLLIFAKDINNQDAAHMLDISIHVVNARSTKLRYRLRFPDRKAMVRAIKEADLLKALPKALVNSLYDEMKQKKQMKINATL
jgi:hypothetical protein